MIENRLNLKKCIIPAILLCALFIAAGKSPAQTPANLPVGKTIEKVAVDTDPNQSYVLYLPSTYSSEKKWPTLYIFDPVARGPLALERFRQAGEKYSYIVVASNNSRNGLNNTALDDIVKRLWKDTHDKLSIDDNRVYAAGFSGGARVASSLASFCNCLEGIIGSGAGYATEVKPTPKQGYLHFAAIGIDDYNFPELIELERSLARLNLVHRLEFFDGIHQWMPQELTEKALAWMTLQAMRKGEAPKDEKFISEQFAFRVDEAKNLLAAGKLLETGRAYHAIVNDFDGLKDVSEYSKKSSEIDSSAEYKKARKIEDEQLDKQDQLFREIMTLGMKQVGSDDSPGIQQSDLRRAISDLNKKAQSTDEAERHVAKRALAEVYANAFETAVFTYEPLKKYDLAVRSLMLAAEVTPKNSYIRFELAKAYALAGQKKNSLSALQEAIDKGFSDAGLIQSEDAFAGWQTDDKFQKLLAQIKEKSAAPSQ